MKRKTPSSSFSSSSSTSASVLFSPPSKRQHQRPPSAPPAPPPPPAKDYCSTPPKLTPDNTPIWPAPSSSLSLARTFLLDCAANQHRTLLVPDKDADGLSAGVIAYRTLLKLGLPLEKLGVHLLAKGTSVHDEAERQRMAAWRPERVVVLDMGSRRGPKVVEDAHVQCLVIDHHARIEGENPEGALVCSACDSPPVATASLLTYVICCELEESIRDSCGYLAAIGTHGDLGTTLRWKPPFPSMDAVFKAHTKKVINDCVSLLNAPRRTDTFDVISAWNALSNNPAPEAILQDRRLLAARAEVNAEVERCTHVPPKFSRDGRIALLRIRSKCQVHPVIATRWAGHLKSKDLEVVMVANEGYLSAEGEEEGQQKVNFSCRIARCARDREGDGEVNVIRLLKEEAGEELLGRMGESFARGHKEASGGIVAKDVFEEFVQRMGVGEKKRGDDAGTRAKAKPPEQKNNLMNYFAVKT